MSLDLSFRRKKQSKVEGCINLLEGKRGVTSCYDYCSGRCLRDGERCRRTDVCMSSNLTSLRLFTRSCIGPENHKEPGRNDDSSSR